MEPHGVVQAGPHEAHVVPRDVVGQKGRVEQGHVGGVGHHAGMQQGIVGQAAVRPQPHLLARFAPGLLAHPRPTVHEALVDRAGPLVPVAQLLLVGRHALLEGGKGLGIGCVGHGELVLEALLLDVERCREVEDGAAALDGDHPTRREGPAVADAVHLVEDRHRHVSGAQEVGVEGVHPVVALHRAPRGHQGLARHLAPVHALALLVGAHPAEDVHLDGLEVQDRDEVVQRRAHGHHPGRAGGAAHLGGWEVPDTADLFARYCERAAAHLGDLIGWACTFNEPNIVATMGYMAGVFPPGRRDPALRRAVNDIFIDAHRKSADAIRSGPGDVPVGLTLAMSDYQAVDGGEDKRARIRRVMEDVYLEAARDDDFIGVQTYSRSRIGPQGALGPAQGVPTTQMGYEFWPEALEATVRRAWEVAQGVPVLVTENGIGTDDDGKRIEYVRRALEGVLRCLDDGIDVRGYTYWSALDNFEWSLGYRPTFGIVAVDRATQHRAVKPSGYWLGQVAAANALVAP